MKGAVNAVTERQRPNGRPVIIVVFVPKGWKGQAWRGAKRERQQRKLELRLEFHRLRSLLTFHDGRGC